MSEPTLADIIDKAKQLCRLDSLHWSQLDFQDPMAPRGWPVAGMADRETYLKKAHSLLTPQQRRLAGETA
jgi:hypothetical protein